LLGALVEVNGGMLLIDERANLLRDGGGREEEYESHRVCLRQPEAASTEPGGNWGKEGVCLLRYIRAVNGLGGLRVGHEHPRLPCGRSAISLFRTSTRTKGGTSRRARTVKELGWSLRSLSLSLRKQGLPTASNSRRGLSRSVGWLRVEPPTQLRLRADKLPSPSHCESRDLFLVFKNRVANPDNKQRSLSNPLLCLSVSSPPSFGCSGMFVRATMRLLWCVY